MCQLHFHGDQPSLLCMCTKINIFLLGGAMNRKELRKQMSASALMRSWTLNRIIVPDALPEPAATLSILRLNNPVLFSVQRLNRQKLKIRGDYTQCGIKGRQTFFYFHLEPVWERGEEERGSWRLRSPFVSWRTERTPHWLRKCDDYSVRCSLVMQ